MPSLPAVFVELKANASQFTAAMQSAQNEIKKTADTAQTNSERMAQVGKVAFAGLGAAATAFGALAVKAALEGEVAHAQLAQAVQNTGQAFSTISPAVDEMSARFAKLGFENDAVEEALAKLVQVSGDVKGSMQEMGLVADFARARHMDLAEAAGVVGKVMGGNVTILSRLGFATKDAAGNTLTAAQALQMLNDRLGGSAQAQANTYAGRLQALNAEWHNMIEQVGNLLLPVLANLAGHMADVAGWFEQHKSVTLALAGAIGGPLVAAMTIYIAKQAMAFGETIATQIGNVAKAIFAIVPAAEAAEGAEAGLAATTALATGGLSLLGAGVGLVAAHFLTQSSAHQEVASTAAGAQSAIEDLTGGEDGLGGAATGATAAMKAQSDLFKQLSGDVGAQQSELIKLMGDQQNVDRATKALSSATTNQAQAQAAATAAADKLSSAQKKLNDATDTYNKLQEGLGQKIASDQNHAHHDLEQAQLNHEEAQTKLTDAVRDYGANSQEARQASLDLESATFSLSDAQEAMGHVGEAAWKEVDSAQQTVLSATAEVTKATDDQTKAQQALNTQTSEGAANTLAWQQAQATLNADWKTFEATIAAHPELRASLAQQLKDMKANLPTGADAAPLNALLDKLNGPLSPSSLVSAFLNNNVAAVMAGLANLEKSTSSQPLAPLLPPVGPNLTGPGSPVPPMTSFKPFGFADGGVVPGPIGAAQWAVVHGGETVTPPGQSSGQVIINIYGNGRDDQELALVIRDELVRMGKSNGSSPGL